MKGVQVENLFIGEYRHQLDEKGRLAIPAKFRGSLKKGAVVTKGLEGCLFVYTPDEWKTLTAKLKAMPISSASARAFNRQLLAGAMLVELDSQGRINLPKYLIDFAALKAMTVVAGLMDRLEIWNTTPWESYQKKTDKDYETLAEQLLV